MKPRLLPLFLMTALLAGSLAHAASSAIAPAQKKNPLIWEAPVKIVRVKKKNREYKSPIRRQQVAPLLTLQWRLLERENNNRQVEADSSREFATGDQLKLAITTNQDGYLYLVYYMEGSDGITFFPDPRINGGKNFVRKNQEYVVPAYCKGVEDLLDPNDCWLTMTPPAGLENFIVIFSRDKITSLPNEVAAPGSAVKREIIAELESSSQQSISEEKGKLAIPGRADSLYATWVQNTNRKDNEELITRIKIKHGE